MVQIFEAIVLGTLGTFCLFTTWSSATRPARFAEQLGLAAMNSGGVNEIRSQYAGFFGAVALCCGGGLVGAIPRPAVFLLLAVVFGGLIVGRLISLVVNHGFDGFGPTIRALYLIDAIGFTTALLALVITSRT